MTVIFLDRWDGQNARGSRVFCFRNLPAFALRWRACQAAQAGSQARDRSVGSHCSPYGCSGETSKEIVHQRKSRAQGPAVQFWPCEADTITFQEG